MSFLLLSKSSCLATATTPAPDPAEPRTRGRTGVHAGGMTDERVRVLLRGGPQGDESLDLDASVVVSPIVHGGHYYERASNHATTADGRAVFVHAEECRAGHS